MPAIFTYVSERVRIAIYNIKYNLIIHADVYYHIIGQSVQKGALTPLWVEMWVRELFAGGAVITIVIINRISVVVAHGECVTSGVRGLDWVSDTLYFLWSA